MSKKIYGIFVGTKWGMTTSKALAIRLGQVAKGEVRSVNDTPEHMSWDMPTFYTCSTTVKDFRETPAA